KKAIATPSGTAFDILESRREDEQSVLIPPDLATCDDCLAEMTDPSDRRYRYPFINCTNCGPRYTIIRALPYDRPKTTMAPFPMCPACRKEYEDHADRRFHAQPNACFDCGPSLWLTDPAGQVTARGQGAVERCSRLLDEGKIVAVKGIGGFHIACSPFREDVVATLRRRKRRPDKPFAVMVPSLGEAERLVHLPAVARKLLSSPQRPVVLCCERSPSPIARGIAPGQRSLGIMLPYSPIHHLLLAGTSALVMTSANFSDAPIVSGNDEALDSLREIVDFILFSDRDIHMPIDDSVAVPFGRTFFLTRRARGYTPIPMAVKGDVPVLFGAGAEMKGSFCIARGNLLFPGQYLGDMKQRGTAVYYNRAIDHFLSLYNLRPEYLVHDMHPQFIPTALAMKKLAGTYRETLAVQHHHAHFAACLLENGHDGQAIGVLFDGTGYGPDGTIWGGEFFVGDASGYRRLGHLFPSRLPGGDASVREPWRYALALLSEAFGEEASALGLSLWPEEAERIHQILSLLPSSPVTTSCGRLFDGAAALLGIGATVSYDGQAAMELEGVAWGQLEAPFLVEERDAVLLLDWRPAVRWLLEERQRLSVAELAGGIHRGLARGVLEVCRRIRERTGLETVALSGGVWQNRRLLAETVLRLRRDGFTPLLHRLVPPNDECVSVGQVAVGASRWRR
ncbi:MAG TPA: carbamoyltransferase HypF, partial [Synergistaceae bacterium]|nr:carbamoyltransferase HypF [Synergistaceae bacterium]